MSNDYGIGEGEGKVLAALLVFSVLGAWKVVELVWWVWNHLSWS